MKLLSPRTTQPRSGKAIYTSSVRGLSDLKQFVLSKIDFSQTLLNTKAQIVKPFEMTVITPSNRFYLCLSVVILFLSTTVFPVEVKLKDISRIQGLRDNQITGYGIVTGLSGTGDTKSAVTNEAMKNYLKNQGLGNAKGANITRNIASVLITAIIPSHARVGDKIDVTIASIGDARSLEGGVLIQSPLKGANNEVVAVASGVLSFGGKDNNRSSQPYNATSYLYGNTANVFTGSSHTKNSPKTVGLIVGGAIVEKELKSDFFFENEKDKKEDRDKNYNKYRIVLENQDFTTLSAVNQLIKDKVKVETRVLSPTEIEFTVPDDGNALATLAAVENLQVTPDGKARVVINERTGTIVMGANVTVDEVAISKQGINVIISNKKKDSDDTKVELISVIQEGTRVSDIVDALNKIGASTKDIIAILEGMKKAGALHAEVIVQMSEFQNAINLNRLNLGENSIQNIQRMNDSLKSAKTSVTFEEALQKEVNEALQGRVSSSSIRLPQNIKAEVAADPYRKKLFDASVEFESIFVKMMLSQMKKSVEKSGLIDGGHAEEIFDDMLYDEYAKNISKTESLGIAEEIYKSLSKSLPKVDLKG